jgi:transposase
MAQTLNPAIVVVGIEIGKNSFHIVGHDERGAIVLRQKWSRGQIASRFCRHAALPGRHGGLRRCASSQPQAQDAWPRCPADAGEVRSAQMAH